MQTKTLTQTYDFTATPEQVFAALTDPTAVGAWSGAAAVTSARAGGRLELWGGSVTGENLSVERPHRLVQSWHYDGWNEPSTVTFALTETESGTTLALTQEQLPADQYDEFAQGWIDNYYQPIAEYLADQP